MGLDIYAQNTGQAMRVGTYSGVHTLRKIVAMLVAKYFHARKDEEKANIAASFIPFELADTGEEVDIERLNLSHFDDDSDPCYMDLPCPDDEPEIIMDAVLSGLSKFVMHSDCCGGHSAGETKDIAKMFEAAIKACEETEIGLSAEDKAWVRAVGEFFIDAAKSDSPIMYG